MPIKKLIRTIPDFPKPGIMFRDVTTLFQDPEGFRTVIEILRERYADQEIDAVVGVESRGFIVGAPLALALGCAFIPMRKPGKLPAATHSETYELEYGTDELHIHVDAIKPGERVLIIDDLLATGGTARAAARLVRHCQGFIVEAAFIVDLPDLKGHEKLEDDGVPVFAICEFEGD
jgi:adenine phosphoribosyltransferase